jgi:hypothetical protein
MDKLLFWLGLGAAQKGARSTAEGVARFSFLTGPTPQSSSGCIIPYEKGRSFQ